MIGYYNYTVILTYIGTLFGFIGITYTMNGNPYTCGSDLRMSLICLMIAGFCDMFDGKIASTMDRTKQEKRFGVQIDSLSDLICFGVLPALIVYRCSGGGFPSVLISAAYVLCALIRLAWFNVDEEHRQDSEENGRTTYLGLPVTTSALLIPSLIGSGQLLKVPADVFCPWVLLPIAVAFVSPFKLRKPEIIGMIMMALCGVAIFALVLIGVSV